MQIDRISYLLYLTFILGFTAFVGAAPPLQLPSLSLFANSLNQTILGCDLPLSATPTPNTLAPQDPYYYDVPGSLVSVKFSDYSKPMSEACAMLAISQAGRQAALSNPTKEIGQYLKYQSFNVILFLNPYIGNMQWGPWKDATQALQHFVTISQPLGTEFEVTLRNPFSRDRDNERVLGVGSLTTR